MQWLKSKTYENFEFKKNNAELDFFLSLIFFEICLDLAQIEEAKGQQQN